VSFSSGEAYLQTVILCFT